LTRANGRNDEIGQTLDEEAVFSDTEIECSLGDFERSEIEALRWNRKGNEYIGAVDHHRDPQAREKELRCRDFADADQDTVCVEPHFGKGDRTELGKGGSVEEAEELLAIGVTGSAKMRLRHHVDILLRRRLEQVAFLSLLAGDAQMQCVGGVVG